MRSSLSLSLMLSRSGRLQGWAQCARQCGEFAETAHELSTDSMLAPPATCHLPAPPALAPAGGQRQMCFRLAALVGCTAAPQSANNVHSRSPWQSQPKIKIFLVSRRRPLRRLSSYPQPMVAINRRRSTL